MMTRIVIDTREQQPYNFSGPNIEVIRKALPAGDYSLDGYEKEIAIERKSLADFIYTVVRSRDRFFTELKKFSTYRLACIVVEANFRDILEGRYSSKIKVNSLLGFITTIIVNFKIPIYFCSDRQAAVNFVEALLTRCRNA